MQLAGALATCARRAVAMMAVGAVHGSVVCAGKRASGSSNVAGGGRPLKGCGGPTGGPTSTGVQVRGEGRSAGECTYSERLELAGGAGVS
ncbi:hypothetical protein BU25DRAFT_260004 [Macroventuria anomochaeta]|uniref:Uncharacterized protein n=1 Tax=Macroventuria anomochaeta TaxID=301207 RepID=A0ACB6S7B8_9PLEO|nr:uncharacterized protein BU25DRAFT_260004 [Macroventuria anomochaeta]KAF2629863.1 hypothetical protein BU25DRAFT_260004 [Macroventuria anomochaeta]